jgi:hypothetical protein
VEISKDIEEKIIRALSGGTLARRALSRRTGLKVHTIDIAIESMVSRGLLKVVKIDNTHGRPSTMVSLLSKPDNSPEARQRRINALSKKGLLYHG